VGPKSSQGFRETGLPIRISALTLGKRTSTYCEGQKIVSAHSETYSGPDFESQLKSHISFIFYPPNLRIPNLKTKADLLNLQSPQMTYMEGLRIGILSSSVDGISHSYALLTRERYHQNDKITSVSERNYTTET